jgi:hypothetical protein
MIFQICNIENLVTFSKTVAKFVKFTPKKTRNFKIFPKDQQILKRKYCPTLDGLET